MGNITSAFETGIGYTGSYLLYVCIGMIFFLPGFTMLTNENSKPEEEQKKTTKTIGWCLMCIGSCIGLGIGFSETANELPGVFSENFL
jgi:hypothetical protein